MAVEVDGVDVHESRPPRAWVTIVLSVVALGITIGAIDAAVKLVPSWLSIAPTYGTIVTLHALTPPVVLVPLLLLFARMQSRSAFDFLGLRMPSASTLALWTAITLVFIVVAGGVTWLLGYEVVPEVNLAAADTAPMPVLLFVGVVVGAPLSEEFLFRGYLFRGILTTRLGFVGTALLTSAAWALLHRQYDFYHASVIFCMGLLLAVARYSSRSVVVSFWMHSVTNLISAAVIIHLLSRRQMGA